MYFEIEGLYHIYNRSNTTSFREIDNYLFFINKVKKHIQPYCEIFAWCLMPNHFHFIVQADERSVRYIEEKHRPYTQQLSKSWGMLLSSYTQAYNKRYGTKGSLWAHQTEAKMLNHYYLPYAMVCFQYIHQNPLRAGLVDRLEDWEFSSFREYLNNSEDPLINQQLAHEWINYDKENFYEQSSSALNEDLLSNIW